MVEWTRRSVLGAGIAALLGGCGWSGDAEDDSAEAPVPKAETAPVAQLERLELRLHPGDRFPLMKTVVQELQQSSVLGPATSQTRLELLLTLTVEEIAADRKRLGVRYNRVRYSQDVAGAKLDYDSAATRGAIPKAALPYHGLVGNGFSFWIGQDNQILEPVGFSEFLERCVRDVPLEERREVLAKFAQTTADEGIANFVDDSIGLLPYDVDGKRDGGNVAEGDSWSRERRLLQPMPLYLKTRYTLRELTPHVAEIDVLGTVTNATTTDSEAASRKVTPASAESGGVGASSTPDVVVKRGSTLGSCTIDRGTGLPLKSHVERYLDMTVTLPNGLEFEQRKRTVTTIQAFPQQKGGSGSPAASTASRGDSRPIEIGGPRRR